MSRDSSLKTGGDNAIASVTDDSNRKCIVFVIEALTVGGAEQMLVAMANLFHGRGWESHMICLTMPGELAEKLQPGVTLHVLNKKPGVDFSLPVRLRRLIRDIKPTAVNCHLWTANTWTRLSLIASGIAVVATEHSRDTWKGKHYRVIDRLLASAMKKLVAVSNDTADFYRTEVGIPANKVTVINNGIDTARYRNADGASLRQELAPNNELLIGTVGRMVDAKNHPRLVKVAAALRESLSNFRVVFVGDGPGRSVLQKSIDEHDVADLIVLTGARSDVPAILHALDIFVLSSDREGHPLTALESQAAGTPVVLTNAGGSADAITRNVATDPDSDQTVSAGGFLVEKSSSALVEAIKQLAEDPDLRMAMGEFGKHQALTQFDEQAMVDQYERLFTGRNPDPV